MAELAGANGIVVHLREDRRHIQDRDLRILRQTVKTKLNLEMAPTREMMEIALEVKPDMVTLVPEKRQEITTEGGLDVLANTERLLRVVGDLKKKGVFVSLFIDPDIKQIKSAKVTKADMLEIHTGGYTEAKIYDKREKEFKKIEEAVKTTLQQGLKVAAGHGLNYINVKSISSIVGIEELNIGHSIIARSVFVGVERAVREMLELCK